MSIADCRVHGGSVEFAFKKQSQILRLLAMLVAQDDTALLMRQGVTRVSAAVL